MEKSEWSAENSFVSLVAVECMIGDNAEHYVVPALLRKVLEQQTVFIIIFNFSFL